MPKVGVVLSGCGVNDGAEIHESVITMLSLDRAGAEMVLMAPNIDQLHVINHANGEEMEGESRNVLVESARIARGEIKDIVDITAQDIDALIFPGGFGTFDELFDVLTLLQSKKISRKIPIVLFGCKYWDGLINWERMISNKVISRSDLDLFVILDSVDEIFNYLIKKMKK